eukprot:12631210-Alexandrium_andersonii.AAC.1
MKAGINAISSSGLTQFHQRTPPEPRIMQGWGGGRGGRPYCQQRSVFASSQSSWGESARVPRP